MMLQAANYNAGPEVPLPLRSRELERLAHRAISLVGHPVSEKPAQALLMKMSGHRDLGDYSVEHWCMEWLGIVDWADGLGIAGPVAPMFPMAPVLPADRVRRVASTVPDQAAYAADMCGCIRIAVGLIEDACNA